MNKIIKCCMEFFTNTKIVKKKDLKLDISKYEEVVYSKIKPKKDWFKVLHLYLLENTVKSEDELFRFFEQNKIDKKEFEIFKDDFIAFCLESNGKYSDFQLSEIKKIVQ